MLDRIEVRKMLDRFGGNVVAKAKANFASKNASGKGSKSIGYDVEVFKNSFSMVFEMEDYMEYQDKGVSGTERKFKTPYRYTNKMPPPSAFDKWSIRRGLAGRDEKGRFLSRRSLNYALAMYIFKKGIRPSKFFTRAFGREFKDLPDEIVEAYGLDVEKFMASALNAKRT